MNIYFKGNLTHRNNFCYSERFIVFLPINLKEFLNKVPKGCIMQKQWKLSQYVIGITIF